MEFLVLLRDRQWGRLLESIVLRVVSGLEDTALQIVCEKGQSSLLGILEGGPVKRWS
jgi:hypothetical protein